MPFFFSLKHTFPMSFPECLFVCRVNLSGTSTWTYFALQISPQKQGLVPNLDRELVIHPYECFYSFNSFLHKCQESAYCKYTYIHIYIFLLQIYIYIVTYCKYIYIRPQTSRLLLSSKGNQFLNI